jgi:predicted lipid-binding transport protein (Tim44 family)
MAMKTPDDDGTLNRQKRLLMFKQFINQVRHAAGAITRGTAALGLAGLLALGALAANDAEAKRVGGSQSIGRQTQAAPQSGQTQRSQQAQPAQQAQSPAAAAGNRWMGPLAGIAAGLGIAALLSSFGLGEQLAQMLSNALLIGLVIFGGMMLYRFIANRRRPDLAYGQGAAGRQPTNGSPFLNRIGQPRSEANPGGWGRPAAGAAATVEVSSMADQAAFLVSAKDMFMRLQSAWDRNEQGDMFELTTPEMFMRLKQDLEARGRERSVTEVTRLDAEVLSTERNADETLVSVRFHGQMREDDNQTAEPFQEIWNLVKGTHGDQTWRLAGIQQLDR